MLVTVMVLRCYSYIGPKITFLTCIHFLKPCKLGHKKKAFRSDPVHIFQDLYPKCAVSSTPERQPRATLIANIVLGVVWPC